MLSNAEIRTTVEQAFRPLRCVAEIWDYDQKLRFKVFDDDRAVIEVPRLVLRDLRETDNLTSVLVQARSEVEDKGFDLERLAL